MITDEGQYFLYRHIRNDKNEVFYIGIGTKKNGNTIGNTYNRAYLKAIRNVFWKRIVNKTTYSVEIVCESDSYDFIQKKEIEFVLLYGRKDLKTGTLCNLTDGGEGQLGVKRKMTDDTKKKISASNKDKSKSEEHKKALSDSKLLNPVKYWKDKTFNEDHKTKLSDAKKKQFENHVYAKSNRDHNPKCTIEDRKLIYKDTAIRNSGKGNRFSKTYEIEYYGDSHIEKTTLAQIYVKYGISQFKAEKILKNGSEYKGLKIKLIEQNE